MNTWIDNSHIISLLREHKRLSAIEYVKRCTDWDAEFCLDYVDEMMNSAFTKKEEGTITWFNIKETDPPPTGAFVLVKNTEGAILVARRFQEDWAAFFADGEKQMGELAPTHFAYINHP